MSKAAYIDDLVHEIHKVVIYVLKAIVAMWPTFNMTSEGGERGREQKQTFSAYLHVYIVSKVSKKRCKLVRVPAL